MINHRIKKRHTQRRYIFWLIAIILTCVHFHSTGKIALLGLAASRIEVKVSYRVTISRTDPLHRVKYFLRHHLDIKKFYDPLK